LGVILETERLLLRTWTPEDAPAYFRVTSDPEVMRFIGGGVTDQTLEETGQRLVRLMGHQEKHGFGLWAVIEKSTGELAGTCGLKHLDDGPDIEVGYHLGRAFWGKGYATEAARACVRYAFEQLQLAQLLAVVNPANFASQRVLEKCGLSYTGMGYYYKAEVKVYVVRAPQASRS
jgi:ribosomal-protein-alanine N-acetyltransferase